jgi:hypothetical protein
MTITFKLDYMIDKALRQQDADARGTLKALAGVKLSAGEAREVLPRIHKHKWYVSERLGRDVGLRVAAIDYFENVYESRRVRARSGTLTEKLRRLAKELGAIYLSHQSWKAHDCLFADDFTWPVRGDKVTEGFSI